MKHARLRLAALLLAAFLCLPTAPLWAADEAPAAPAASLPAEDEQAQESDVPADEEASGEETPGEAEPEVPGEEPQPQNDPADEVPEPGSGAPDDSSALPAETPAGEAPEAIIPEEAADEESIATQGAASFEALRAQVESATGAATITLEGDFAVPVGGSAIRVTRDITLNAASLRVLTRQAGADYPFFSVESGGTLRLQNVALDGGMTPTSAALAEVVQGGTLEVGPGGQLRFNRRTLVEDYDSPVRYTGGAVYSAGQVRVTGGIFYGNQAWGFRGCVYLDGPGASLVMESGQIGRSTGQPSEYNNAYAGSGIYARQTSGAGVQLLGGSMAANTNFLMWASIAEGVGNGGALWAGAGVPVTVQNVVLMHNSGQQGGAIYAEGTLSLGEGAVLHNNTARQGAGAYASGSAAMTGGHLYSNVATSGQGGGVYLAESGSFRFSGGVIGIDYGRTPAVGTVNGAQEGGGVYNASTGGVGFVMSGEARLTGNAANGAGGAEGCGGGVYNAGKMKMEGGLLGGNSAISFFNNSYGGTGGGIYNAVAGTLEVTGGIIGQDSRTLPAIGLPNNAVWGGGIYTESSSPQALVLREGAFVGGNTARSYGGGLHTGGTGQVTVAGGVFHGNTAVGGGGGICLSTGGGTLLLSGGTLWGNTAPQGGDIYLPSGKTMQVSGGPQVTGGGIASQGNFSPPLEITGDLTAGARLMLDMAGSEGKAVATKTAGTLEDAEARAFLTTAGDYVGAPGQSLHTGKVVLAAAHLPRVEWTTPTGSDVALGEGEVRVRFAQAVEIAAPGKVALTPAPASPGAWQWAPGQEGRELVLPYDGLAPGTEYQVRVEGFAAEGRPGDTMAPYTGPAFTTEDGLRAVTFHMQNGQPAQTRRLPLGSLLARPADPQRSGHRFVGWHTAEGNPWRFESDLLQGELALYAHWVALPAPPRPPGNDGEAKPAPITQMRLNMEAKVLKQGQSVRLSVRTAQPRRPATAEVQWTSSKPGVARVQAGRVKALAPGKARIMAVAGRARAVCTVTVTKTPAIAKAQAVKSLRARQKTVRLSLGGNKNLPKAFRAGVDIAPATARNKKLAWESLDPTVATVNSRGKITARGAGSTKVVCRSREGGKTATFTVKVSR